MFKVNITKIPTISSLALLIYRSNYMPKDAQIHLTDSKLYNLLRTGYTGGAVDVYKPRPPIINGKPCKVYAYDVNSLYPSVMLKNDKPVGKPTFIKGHLDIHDPKVFGFVFVDVSAPEDLHIPLLQVRVKGRTCRITTIRHTIISKLSTTSE